MQKPDPSAGGDNRVDYAAEFAQLKIENDLVNVFFDEINRMSDSFTFNFIETLKHDVSIPISVTQIVCAGWQIDLIMRTLYQSTTEMATFYTLLTMMLRRLSPVEGSFTNALLFSKQLAMRVNEDEEAPRDDFNKFFMRHLFRNYCALIKECPNKRQQICELIYAHCQHDLQMRIKVVH